MKWFVTVVGYIRLVESLLVEPVGRGMVATIQLPKLKMKRWKKKDKKTRFERRGVGLDSVSIHPSSIEGCSIPFQCCLVEFR